MTTAAHAACCVAVSHAPLALLFNSRAMPRASFIAAGNCILYHTTGPQRRCISLRGSLNGTMANEPTELLLVVRGWAVTKLATGQRRGGQGPRLEGKGHR